MHRIPQTHLNDGNLWFLLKLVSCYILTGLNLTITPSRNVDVNQSVTLHCELDPNPPPPVVVIFSLQSPSTTLCAMEPWNGVCKKTPDPCRNLYNASCPSDTRYSIQLRVPMDWNGASVVCETFLERSNSVVFSVKGMLRIRNTSNFSCK